MLHSSAAATPVSQSFKAQLATVCLLAFAVYFVTSVRLPVVPLFAVALGASPVEVGLINSSFLLMSGLLALPLGVLSDRFGRRRIVLSGLVLAALSSALLFWSRSPGELAAIFLVFGIGLAMLGPSLMAQVADISPADYLGRAYGWYTLAIYTGMGLGPAVGGLLAARWGYRPVFLAVAVALVLLVGPTLLGLRETTSRDRQRSGLWQELWRESWHNHALQACWLLTFGSCFAIGVLITFFPLLAAAKGLGPGEIGLVFAAQAVVNALSRLPLGRMSDQWPKARLTAAGFFLLTVVLLAFGLSSTFPAFLLLGLSSGAVQGLGFTPLGALISEVVPTTARGVAMGGYNTAIYLGMMAGSAAMGPVISRLGFAGGFALAALVNLLTTGCFWLIWRYRAQQQSRQLPSGAIPEILGICESCGAIVLAGFEEKAGDGYRCRRCAGRHSLTSGAGRG